MMIVEYLDDLVIDDRGWPVLVAVVALCLGGIFHCSRFRLLDRPYWSCLPYFLPRHGSGVVWNLGVVLAGFQ